MPPRASPARTLRDVNNASFLHRERARFRAGESALLGAAWEPDPGVAPIVDASGVPELQSIVVRPNGAATIGAFASAAALAEALPALFGSAETGEDARVRLVLLGARVTIAGLGGTRSAPFDSCAFAPHELPIAIELAAPPASLAIAQRRRTVHEDAGPLALGVVAAMAVSSLDRFEHVRIVLDADATWRRANDAEAVLERVRCDRDLFAGAARAAASSLVARDARTSAAVRALQPLVVACLRDAYDAAREKRGG